MEGVKATIEGVKETSEGVKETMHVMLATMLKQVRQWPFTPDPGFGSAGVVSCCVVHRCALSFQREVWYPPSSGLHAYVVS